LNHVVLVLKYSLDEQEFATGYHQTIPVIKVWRNDDIGDAGLILIEIKMNPWPCRDAAER